MAGIYAKVPVEGSQERSNGLHRYTQKRRNKRMVPCPRFVEKWLGIVAGVFGLALNSGGDAERVAAGGRCGWRGGRGAGAGGRDDLVASGAKLTKTKTLLNLSFPPSGHSLLRTRKLLVLTMVMSVSSKSTTAAGKGDPLTQGLSGDGGTDARLGQAALDAAIAADQRSSAHADVLMGGGRRSVATLSTVGASLASRQWNVYAGSEWALVRAAAAGTLLGAVAVLAQVECWRSLATHFFAGLGALVAANQGTDYIVILGQCFSCGLAEEWFVLVCNALRKLLAPFGIGLLVVVSVSLGAAFSIVVSRIRPWQPG